MPSPLKLLMVLIGDLVFLARDKSAPNQMKVPWLVNFMEKMAPRLSICQPVPQITCENLIEVSIGE